MRWRDTILTRADRACQQRLLDAAFQWYDDGGTREGVPMIRLRATYPSELSQLAAMRNFAAEVCRLSWGNSENEEAIYQLQLALTEAATNIIRHAYPGE